jgi:hypothetical protein
VALGLASPGRTPMLIGLSLFAAGTLPFAAYVSGHPFRIRYEIPLIVANALTLGLGIGLFRRAAIPIALASVGLVSWQVPPFDASAPMVREAQLDPNAAARQHVTACLRERDPRDVIMVSMGSLGHYMHEMSADGFHIRDFLHEGNGPLWDSAFTRGPAALVEWVLMEEQAEGGDAIAQRFRAHPALLDGFDRVCEGGGVALYRRRDTTPAGPRALP